MLGLATIGQSPRDDVVASMFGDVCLENLVQAGALDGLGDRDIERLRPVDDDRVLVTRLADGSEVVVGKQSIQPLLQEAVGRLEVAGATVICVLCTGAFPHLTAQVPVVYPDRVLSGVVDAVLPSGRLGVLMPHVDQQDMMIEKWATPRREVITATMSPYHPTDLARAAMTFNEADVNAVVMDCMGFDRAMQSELRSRVSAPVLLANGVVGAVVQELIDISRVPLHQVQ